MDTQQLTQICQDLNIPFHQHFSEIGSTNDVAIGWVNQDYPQYSLALAGAQTKGRGRYDRRWITIPGASIAMSFIVHPHGAEREKLGLFPLLSGLAVCAALETAASLPASVKWPNDILLAGKKTAGILVESIWQGDQLKGLVVGIGINILPESIPRDLELLFPATCVQDHTELNVDPLTIIQEIIRSFKSLRVDFTSPSFIDHYTQNLAYLNQPVELQTGPDKTETGTLHGIHPDGSLLLKSPDGAIKKFPIGDLRLRPQT